LIYIYACIYTYIKIHTHIHPYIQTSNILYIWTISQGEHVCGYIRFMFSVFQRSACNRNQSFTAKGPEPLRHIQKYACPCNSTNTYVCISISLQRSECNGNQKFDVERPRPAAAASSSHSGSARQVAQTCQGYWQWRWRWWRRIWLTVCWSVLECVEVFCRVS